VHFATLSFSLPLLLTREMRGGKTANIKNSAEEITPNKKIVNS
jgi:hypothetical protein